MFILDGKRLQLDTPFEHGDIRYPANWLRLASIEERAAIGITEVAEQSRPDDRFYWVTDNGDGTYTAVPKDLAGLQKMLIDQIDQYAYTTLFRTDWMVIRAVETQQPVPAEMTAYRAAVRNAFEDNKTTIMLCTTVEELQAVVFSWPTDPSTLTEGAAS